MLGVDITKISRFENPSKSLIERILHGDEIEEYRNSKNKPKFLASMWAIKEALYKSDNTLKEFKKIRIIKEDRSFKFENYNISTSSEGDYYIAIVLKGEKNDTKS